MATISQRISLEGSDDIRKKLEALGKAAEQAFLDISRAAGNIGLEKLGKEAATAAAGIAEAGEASGKAAEEIGKVKASTDQAAKSMSKFSLETARAASEIAKNVAAIAKTGVEIVQLVRHHDGLIKSLLKMATAAATSRSALALLTPVMGTTAVVLGTAAGAAVAAAGAIKVVGTAAAAAAGPYAKLAEDLQRLSKSSGQSFSSLQRGEALFKQIGISAESFRGTIGKLAAVIGDLDVGAELKKSANQIVDANNKVLEAERAVIQQRLEGRKIFLIGEDSRLTDYLGDIERLKEIQAELNSETDKARALEDALIEARSKAAIAAANSLSKILEQVKAIQAGQKGITFDSLVTAETKIKAFAISMKQAEEAGQHAGVTLVKFIAAADRASAIQIGKAFDVGEEQVDRIRRIGGGLETVEAIRKRLGSLGVLIPEGSAQAFTEMKTEIEATERAWERLNQAWSTSAFAQVGAEIVTILKSIETGFIDLAARVLEAFNSLGGTVYLVGAIATAFGALALAIGAIPAAIVLVVAAIGTLVVALGRGIWESFGRAGVAAWDAITGAIQSAIDAVLKFIGLRPGTGGGGAAPAPGMARGGLLGGRGSGTSDSNLAWVSRGEHIMPARSVRQPGVLAFLEALRRSGGDLSRLLDGMGRFAMGGPVGMPALAGGGMAASTRNLGTLTLSLPSGGTVSVRASAGVVDQLRKEAAMAQVRSGGRKPSRYT